MGEIMEFLRIYKDFGVAGLFIALYIVTVYYYNKEIKSSKSEAILMVEKVTTVADKAAHAIMESNRTSIELKSGIDQLRAQNNDFISFLRGRDEHRRTGR